MAEENQGGFKVTDRRLFNADGSLREDAQVVENTASVAATPETQSTINLVSTQSPPQAAAAAEAPAGEVEHEQTMFTEFLMGIASSAFIYLGLVEHPATGRRQVDLMAARESIEMLAMLREKTKGNLTRGEEKFFDDLLADLRMQFVSLRR
jgi:hypothetical protein